NPDEQSTRGRDRTIWNHRLKCSLVDECRRQRKRRTDDGLKPLPLTVINVSGPPAGTASGLMDWIAGPDCACAAGKNELHRYKRTETAIRRRPAGVIFYRPLCSLNNIRVWSIVSGDRKS